MSSSFDQFEFVSDSRDGKNFDVIKNLEDAAARGSKLASEMLERLQFLTSRPDYPKPHSQVKAELEDFERRWEVIRAFEEDGEGDEVEDPEELVSEVVEWIEFLEDISAQSYTFILDKYIKYEGYGAFGQGNDYSYDLAFAALITNPLIPRDLLWEFSVGDSAHWMAQDSSSSGNYPWKWIGTAPRFINNLSISPIASTNLLKAINHRYSEVTPQPFNLHTMLNVNADLWLLKELDPESVRDNLIYELKLIESSDQYTFHDELEDLHEFVLNSYFSTPPGIVEYNEAENSWKSWESKFSNSFGIGALLIAIRMSEEFKVGNVKIGDHLESDSIILRTLLYYNPDLTTEQRDPLQRLGIIQLDKGVAEMYEGAWNPNNTTLVM